MLTVLAESSSQLAIPVSTRKRKAEDPISRLSDEDRESLEDLEARRRDREKIHGSKSKSVKSYHKAQATKSYNNKFNELLDKGLVEETDKLKERAGLPPASSVPPPQTSSSDTLPGASSSPVVPASGHRNKKPRISPPEEETTPGPSRKQHGKIYKSDATVQESDEDDDTFVTPAESNTPDDPFQQ